MIAIELGPIDRVEGVSLRAGPPHPGEIDADPRELEDGAAQTGLLAEPARRNGRSQGADQPKPRDVSTRESVQPVGAPRRKSIGAPQGLSG